MVQAPGVFACWWEAFPGLSESYGLARMYQLQMPKIWVLSTNIELVLAIRKNCSLMLYTPKGLGQKLKNN
jgi:hypothetical protein